MQVRDLQLHKAKSETLLSGGLPQRLVEGVHVEGLRSFCRGGIRLASISR